MRLGWTTGSTGLRRGADEGDSRYVFMTAFDPRAALIVRATPIVAILIVLSTVFFRA